jgi:hypothetical protein
MLKLLLCKKVDVGTLLLIKGSLEKEVGTIGLLIY